MSTQIQRRRGTTTEHSSFTGAAGEITVDTTKNTIVVHDGSTAGGFALAKENAPSFTGDATFAGDGTFGNAVSSGSTSGILIQNTGGAAGAAGLHIYQNGVSGEPFIKGYSNSSEGGTKTPKFHINTDGSALFDGTVVVGDNANGYTAPGVYIAKEGYVAASSSTGSMAIWQGFNGTSAETSSIKADGSPTFAGTFKKNTSTGALVCGITDDYLRIYDGPQSLEDFEISLEKDGSATFSGDISINNGSYIRIRTTGDNTSTAIQLAPNGSALFNGDGIVRGIFTVSGTGNTSGIVVGDSGEAKINKDGNATFAGYIKGEGDDSYFTVNRTNITPGSGALYLGFTSGTQKFKVGTDGHIEAASKIESYGDPLATGGAETGSCMHGGSGFAAAAVGDGYPLFRTFKTGQTTPTSQIRSEGSAEFADDVTVGKKLSAEDIESYHPTNSSDLMALNYATLRFTDSSGNDIINLNGQTGHATFTNGINMYRSGTASATRINIGGSDTHAVWQNDGNFIIKYDGSATFASTIQAGGNPIQGSNAGLSLSYEGYVLATGAANATIWYGYEQGTNAITSRIYSNGNAEFGTVLNKRINIGPGVGGTPATALSVYTDPDDNTTETVTIKADGSVRFENNLTVGDDTPWSSSSEHGVYTGSVGTVEVYRDAAGNTTNTYFTGNANGTFHFYILTNGNVTNTNNSYGAISDIKLKENIVDASSQWDDLKQVRVRNYNYKQGETHTQIGVVAQELETVCPKLITTRADVDHEGNDLGTTTKSVNYSVLYMKAVKALQEAMTRIETLEAKVTALESA